MIGSEASWRPPGSQVGTPGSSYGGSQMSESLLTRPAFQTTRPRRASVNDASSFRVPIAVHFERVGRYLKLLNLVLLPLGALVAGAGGICLALNDPKCPSELKVSLWIIGGCIAGFPLFLDVAFLAANAPYSIYNAQSTKDPLSCGPRRFMFPSNSLVPALVAALGVCFTALAIFGGLCAQDSGVIPGCNRPTGEALAGIGCILAGICLYILICLLHGDKGAISVLWVVGLVSASVGLACVSDTLAGIEECPSGLGWTLVAAGCFLAMVIPLVLATVWARKCWPCMLGGGLLLCGAIVIVVGTICLDNIWGRCDAGVPIVVTGSIVGGIPLFAGVMLLFWTLPYIFGEYAAVISIQHWPMTSNILGALGIATFSSLTIAVLAFSCSENFFESWNCEDGSDRQETAFVIMVVGFIVFACTFACNCGFCWQGWQNKTGVYDFSDHIEKDRWK